MMTENEYNNAEYFECLLANPLNVNHPDEGEIYVALNSRTTPINNSDDQHPIHQRYFNGNVNRTISMGYDHNIRVVRELETGCFCFSVQISL